MRLDGTTQIVNLAGLASGRYAMTKVSVSIGKTGAVHRQSEGESACHHPDDSPVNLLPVLGCNHSRKGEYGDREHRHGVGVDAQLLAEYPEYDGYEEGDGHSRGAPVVLHSPLRE